MIFVTFIKSWILTQHLQQLSRKFFGFIFPEWTFEHATWTFFLHNIEEFLACVEVPNFKDIPVFERFEEFEAGGFVSDDGVGGAGLEEECGGEGEGEGDRNGFGHREQLLSALPGWVAEYFVRNVVGYLPRGRASGAEPDPA